MTKEMAFKEMYSEFVDFIKFHMGECYLRIGQGTKINMGVADKEHIIQIMENNERSAESDYVLTVCDGEWIVKLIRIGDTMEIKADRNDKPFQYAKVEHINDDYQKCGISAVAK